MAEGHRFRLPLFDSFAGFQVSWLTRDALAGMTLAAIAIPEQLATARLAGMPPETGLYAFAAGSLAFAVFGANRFMSVGADSTIAPIFAGALAAASIADPSRYGAVSAAFALMVGAILVIAGLIRAGWIADLLSIPVTTGFLAGIAVHIVIGQMPAVLGISVPAGTMLARAASIIRMLPETNPLAAAIGIAVLALTLIAERLSAKIPGALIGLVIAALAVFFFDLNGRGVATLGALAAGLPPIAMPHLALSEIVKLLPLALTVALVCMMQSAAVVRAFPSDPDGQEDVSRDFAGVGAGSILAAFLGAFAVDSSPPRTAVVAESGGRSQLSGIAAVVIIALIVALAGAAFAYVPEAALGGVLIFIGMRIFRLREMMRIARRGGIEILLVAASAALVIYLPIQQGVALSVILSLLHSIYTLARPTCVELERLPGTTIWWPPSPGETGEREPGVFVFAPAAPINFTNANHIRQRLLAALAAQPAKTRLTVIDASAVATIDYTGARILQDMITRLRDSGTDVAMARLAAESAQGAAARSGLLATLGADHLYHSVEDAVRALSHRKS